MSEETYNGWANVFTWVVSNHLTSGEAAYKHWMRAAISCIRKARMNQILPHGDARMDAITDLAQSMEAYIRDEVVGRSDRGIARDMMTHAFGQVDWQEIATHFIDRALEEE